LEGLRARVWERERTTTTLQSIDMHPILAFRYWRFLWLSFLRHGKGVSCESKRLERNNTMNEIICQPGSRDGGLLTFPFVPYCCPPNEGELAPHPRCACHKVRLYAEDPGQKQGTQEGRRGSDLCTRVRRKKRMHRDI
jgi:hypothetical protein